MIVTIDFETFYSQDYSLRRMSEVDYILDPRFETIMCSVKMGNAETVVHVGVKDVNRALHAIDWDRHAMLAHNARFDGAILNWRFNITPALYLDTLSMANALTRAVVKSSSLESLARHFRLPPKGTAVHDMKGRDLASLSQDEVATYAEYCAHDTDLCREIFDRFMTIFPKTELKVIDLSLRMFILPQVVLNQAKLAEHLNLVRAEKAAAFAQVAHISPDRFSSNLKFGELLREYGVEPPTKISPTTGERTLALAKNDREFKDLCADPEQPAKVQVLLACRLNSKSTIEETRAATLLNLSQRSWGMEGDGWMPVPYKYFGAHTGRFSGDGGYNFANLKRGSPLRDAIEAPAGFRIAHRDSSQIEARIVAWLAGCDALVAAFAEGRDVYSEFASRFYGRTVTREDKLERFTGKTAILSLGYGAGAERFRHALHIGQGGVSVTLDLVEADRLVNAYRNLYDEIPRLWRLGNEAIRRMIQATGEPALYFPVVELGETCVWLPNETAIVYPNLRRERDALDPARTNTVYDGPYGGIKKLYGAKLVENVTQALARIVVTDIMLRVKQLTGYRPFMSTYDSHDYIVPEAEAPAFDAILEQQFLVGPAWAEGLPLASEGGWGATLLEAERGVNR